MTLFLLGMLAGAVLAMVFVFATSKSNSRKQEPEATSAKQERLNSRDKQREEMLKELERQYDQMMRYTGKEQRA